MQRHPDTMAMVNVSFTGTMDSFITSLTQAGHDVAASAAAIAQDFSSVVMGLIPSDLGQIQIRQRAAE